MSKSEFIEPMVLRAYWDTDARADPMIECCTCIGAAAGAKDGSLSGTGAKASDVWRSAKALLTRVAFCRLPIRSG